VSESPLAPFDGAMRVAGVPTAYRRALVEELGTHVDARVQALHAGGFSECDARTQAVAELGSPEALAADALATATAWCYRAPLLSFVVAPTIGYLVLAVGAVPALAATLVRDDALRGAETAWLWLFRASAMVGAMLCMRGVLDHAEARPGLESRGFAGAVLIAALSGLVHASVSVHGSMHAFRVRLEPSADLWQMIPAVLLVATHWWTRREAA
jgi:hypothetical protein